MHYPLPRLKQLGNLAVDVFLKEYWQKKPVLLRKAFLRPPSAISADELAGFALDGDVDARLVHHDSAANTWSLEHGPFDQSRFSCLGACDWTLLVRHVDTLDPRVNALANAFQFIPSWRLDDIMVSYATPGGGVGPHFDHFDVFLLQIEGERRWRVGQRCDARTELREDSPLATLRDFHPEHDWVLAPGDMLYLPPQIAHWGEALSPCMTYSIGFRAPSHAEIILGYAQELASRFPEDLRYTDPAQTARQHAGEISQESVSTFRRMLEVELSGTQFTRWLGEYLTENHVLSEFEGNPISEAELLGDTPCRLSACARAVFSSENKTTWCFVNGHSWACSPEFAVIVSEKHTLRYSRFTKRDAAILRELARLHLLHAAKEA